MNSTPEQLGGDRFSWKWRNLPQYGFDEATARFQQDWYVQKFGWGTKENLYDFLATCSAILDAGCGLGRDVGMYSQHTKGTVYGVDISESVKLTQERFSGNPNICIIQADMTNLDLPDKYFDFIVCDQALHHTPDTGLAFKSLVRKLKIGGQIAIYVYNKKGPAREYADDMIRGYTTKMSEEDCYKFAEACTEFGKAVSEIDLRLQRSIYWGLFKCFWNSDFDHKTNVMVNFDWYFPLLAWRHTIDDVERWFLEENVRILHLDIGQAGISARGIKY